MRKTIFVLTLLLLSVSLNGQDMIVVSGSVRHAKTNEALNGATITFRGRSTVTTNSGKDGRFSVSLPAGQYTMQVYYEGLRVKENQVDISRSTELDITLDDFSEDLAEVVVEDAQDHNQDISRLNSVEGTAIFESKKNEVVILKDVTANLAVNNARQIFAKVPGLNIWESDRAGLQLGIAARGLDPNRTSNFNVRQNGYDISADPLGYPESYYTPPAEGVDRIEVVRGAASLQYGTQFGGLLNFRMKEGGPAPLEVISRQTLGSFNLFNSFNSVGGTTGKVNYYAFFQYKVGDGWRPNSGFNADTEYAAIKANVTQNFSLFIQYTRMRYQAQQPGGLTDAIFAANPRQSIRERNWFEVKWNLIATGFDWRINDRTRINSRFFSLIGSRDAVGNLGRIDRSDDGKERDLFVDDFQNIGNETRVMRQYRLFEMNSVFLGGVRYYRGMTTKEQGLGSENSDADFTFSNTESGKNSDYEFPGNNESIFAENIFTLSRKFTVTPGIRFERIETMAEGVYSRHQLIADKVTGVAKDTVVQVSEKKHSTRSFPIAGIGLSFRPNDNHEFYGNFSQNYRAINFNDIRVVNPNLRVDPDIHDERGFNADIGARGAAPGFFNYDVSIFFMKYDDRIGNILQADSSYNLYRYRTNISDSHHAGVELFGQMNLLRLLNVTRGTLNDVTTFANVSLINARYVDSKQNAVSGNQVELVPHVSVKAGMSVTWKDVTASFQYAYVSSQYTDATNAIKTASAVEGVIPAYVVADFSARYSYKFISAEAGINNLFNAMYFTRRAASYPGPGIIPSDGRNIYFCLQVKVAKRHEAR